MKLTVKLFLLMLFQLHRVLQADDDIKETLPKLPISIETSVTWSTILQPEYHLLVRNHSDQNLEISIIEGTDIKDAKIECADNISKVFPRFFSRINDVYNFEPSYITYTFIPAGAWVHRSAPLGEAGLIPPCRIPYSIYSYNSQFSPIEGIIEVPNPTASPNYGHEFSATSLTAEYVVEVNEVTHADLVLRLLVYNHEPHNLRVYVTDRELSCRNGTRAKWSLHGGPLQRASVGPQYVLSQHWTAFVAAIELEGDKRPGDCTGWMEFASYDAASQLIPFKTVDFSLLPTGIYTYLPHGSLKSLEQKILDFREGKANQ